MNSYLSSDKKYNISSIDKKTKIDAFSIEYLLEHTKHFLEKASRIHQQNENLNTHIKEKLTASKDKNDLDTIKIVYKEIENHLKSSSYNNEALKKSYSNLLIGINGIYDNHKDKEYELVFDDNFAKMKIQEHINEYKQNGVDSGIFFISILDRSNINKPFRHNVYKTFITNLAGELKKHDTIAHIKDNVFICIVPRIERNEFNTYLHNILKSTHEGKETKQITSATMLSSFEKIDDLYFTLWNDLNQARLKDGGFIFN